MTKKTKDTDTRLKIKAGDIRKVLNKRAAEEDAARKGKLPKAPDFSAPSRERYRNKLAGIVKLVKAKDVSGLQALMINPIDSAHKIMGRYRDTAVIALQAKG